MDTVSVIELIMLFVQGATQALLYKRLPKPHLGHRGEDPEENASEASPHEHQRYGVGEGHKAPAQQTRHSGQ